jgi:F0F1-type ATP synthase assembly protein I
MTNSMNFLTKRIVPKNKAKKSTLTGSSDSLGRGPEMAISVLVFTVIGLVIDSAVGSMPMFTIGLVIFSVVGNFARLYYTYGTHIEALAKQRLQGTTSHQHERVAK